jgi:hypothetical protein
MQGFHLFRLLSFCLLISPGTFCSADGLVLLSTSGSGRATGYSEASKIITAAGKTHVAWQDSNEKGFEVKIRSLDHSTKNWSHTYTIGDAQDNHGGPALVIDSKGYLHACYYPHSQPMRYRKSLRPHDASEWSKELQFGERLTYPTLLIGPDDTLYMTARRRGGRNQKWMLEFYSKPTDGDWSSATQLIEANEPSYAHFEVSLAWGPDHKTMHLATRMYGDVPRWGYLIGYMKSIDFGKTWQRADTTPIELPATKHTLDKIFAVDPKQRAAYENACALRGGSIAVDAENSPYLLYTTLKADGTPVRQSWIAHADGKSGWTKTLLNDKIKVLPQNWGLAMGAGLSIDEQNRMAVVLSMADDLKEPEMWGSTSSEVVWAESHDGGKTFTSRVISSRDAGGPNWLPNIEKPTGFNQVPSNPNVIYLSGDRGVDNNAILQGKVYFWTSSLDLAR